MKQKTVGVAASVMVYDIAGSRSWYEQGLLHEFCKMCHDHVRIRHVQRLGDMGQREHWVGLDLFVATPPEEY